MSSHERPAPIQTPYFSRGTMVLVVIALVGIGSYLYRMIAGLGAVTNLTDQYPWGIWIAIDVASGVALAAGGFTTAALAEVFHRDKYHVIVRPALLTAMLGYTFVVIGLLADLGRYYNVWHPLLPSMWQGNSVLFEVGMCVMIYLTVLYIEFLPIVVERFKGRVKLPGGLSGLNGFFEGFLDIADKTLGRVTWLFIIAGVVLSCLHQSSLGTLMIIAPTKMHPLWYTSISPLLFLLSAIAVGFPMVIFESILASRSFRLKPETKVLSSVARYTPALLAVYLALKLGDITLREAWPYVTAFTPQSWAWIAEMLLGVVAPLLILSIPRFRKTIPGLFIGASLVIFGVAFNRINVFLTAYKPLYADKPYFPSFFEIAVTVGLIATLVLVYRAMVMIFPVIAGERREESDYVAYDTHTRKYIGG
ncbi:MAG: NrfD/PsrC family molybdoenzyme membrane anchor subunit [Candidatus Eisenbacteria bacterium]